MGMVGGLHDNTETKSNRSQAGRSFNCPVSIGNPKEKKVVVLKGR